jgi:hypothetical protein
MRWRKFWQRRRRDQELAYELNSYLAHEIDENLAREMDPDAARYAASRKLGNTTQVRETIYDMNSLSFVDGGWQDLKYGLRQLRLKPGFTAAAVLSLALGIGANAGVFTLLDQILLRLLPVHNPHELVQLRVEGGRFGSNDGDDDHTFSYPTYLALRDRNGVFTGLTGQRTLEATLVGKDRNEMVTIELIAGNYYSVFGLKPHPSEIAADSRQLYVYISAYDSRNRVTLLIVRLKRMTIEADPQLLLFNKLFELCERTVVKTSSEVVDEPAKDF